MRKIFLSVNLLAVALVCANLLFSCRNFQSSAWGNFKAGQKLSGRYEHGVPVESYIFKDDGTYKHEDAGDKNSRMESGTYHIDGETITFQSGGKSVSKKIAAVGAEVDKQSPSKIDLDLTTFELVSDEQFARRNNNSGSSTASADNTPPAEYAKLAPDQVGEFARLKVSKDTPTPQSNFIERYQFNYEKNNYLYITKYATEADAQATLKKRISEAVPTAEYDRKVKLPKCNPNKETDYDTPEELVKTIPLSTGGEAVVFHPSKFWDYKCKLVSNGEETLSWTKGAYFFSISSSLEHSYDDYTMAFGYAESFLNIYLAATGQK